MSLEVKTEGFSRPEREKRVPGRKISPGGRTET